MARRKALRSYFEPWSASRSKTREAAFANGPPPVPGDESDVRQAALDWVAKRAQAEKDADWIIWGSGMAEPGICHKLNGTIFVTDDRRIIAIRRWLGLPVGSPSHEDVAQRIVDCVNACAGIGDPGRFVEDVRALLLEYARGESSDPREDRRVISLLGRCIPPDEVRDFSP